MTWFEFIKNKSVSSIFEFVLTEETGNQNDRIVSHLRKQTRAYRNSNPNDLYHMPSFWTRDLIKHLVEQRFKHNDISTGTPPSNP